MVSTRRCRKRSAAGGARPPGGGRAESAADGRASKAGTKRTAKKKTSKAKKAKKTAKKKAPKRQCFTPDEKRAAVEAFYKSGVSQTQFARMWGLSHNTLRNWVQKYNEVGPKGLERKPHAGKGKMRIASVVRDEIVAAKRFFPSFGFKRIRDYLFRFRGVKVSEGSIGKTLKQAEIPPTPQPKKKRRKKKVKRFERAKPGALWQSDITSYLLPRHGTRAYLTVFLDDHSRYVVSFALAHHQKHDLVMEALLSGIDRFGKPKEVLTDQGRQYFSWRGKGVFQKYLEQHGIRHVVARSHHPQTVVKCERLWKTIRTEFWERVQPQELGDARDRLEHYFAHYNHHRPHQGIKGLVPADRFFGAESEVRKALEAQHAENELRLAVGEQPRRGVYLVGRIGDKSVSMHGERGKLVIHSPDGGVESLAPRELGAPQEVSNDGSDEGRDTGNNNGDDERGSEEAVAHTAAEEGVLSDAEKGVDAGAGAVGIGERGGEEKCAPDGGGHPGGLAGPGEQEGGGRAPEPAGLEAVAAVAASTLGDGGGTFETAPQSLDRPGGGESLEAQKADRQTGEGSGEPATAGEPLAGDAGSPPGATEQGGEPCPEEEEGGCPTTSSERSGSDSESEKQASPIARPWPWPTE